MGPSTNTIDCILFCKWSRFTGSFHRPTSPSVKFLSSVKLPVGGGVNDEWLMTRENESGPPVF